MDILTIVGSATGGAGIYKLIDYFLLPKKDKKDFDIKMRDELWDRIKNLEGRIDEQNKMIMQVMQENATLKAENIRLKDELEEHIKKQQ